MSSIVPNKTYVRVKQPYEYIDHTTGTPHKYAVDDIIELIGQHDDTWLKVTAEGRKTESFIPHYFVEGWSPQKRIASVRPNVRPQMAAKENSVVDRETSLMARELSEAIQHFSRNFRACPSYLKPVSDPEQYDDGGNYLDSSFEDGDTDDYDNAPKPSNQELREMKKLKEEVNKLNEKIAQMVEVYEPSSHPPGVPVFVRPSSKDADGYVLMTCGPRGHTPAAAQDKGSYTYVETDKYLPKLSTAVDHDHNEMTFANTYADKFFPPGNTVRIRKAKLRESRQETKNASKLKVYLGVFLEYRKVERTYVIIIHVVLTCDFMELKSTNGTKLYAYKRFLVYEERGDPVIHVESLQWEPYNVNYKEEPNTAQLDNLWQGLSCEVKFTRQFKSRMFLPVVPKIVKFDISVVQEDTPKTILNVFAEKKEMKAEKYGKKMDGKKTDTDIPPFPELAQQQDSEHSIRDNHSSFIRDIKYGETQSPTTDKVVYSVPSPPEIRQRQTNGALHLDQQTSVPGSAQQREEPYRTRPKTDPHYATLIRRTPPIPASRPPGIPRPKLPAPRKESSPNLHAQSLNYVNFPVTPGRCVTSSGPGLQSPPMCRKQEFPPPPGFE